MRVIRQYSALEGAGTAAREFGSATRGQNQALLRVQALEQQRQQQQILNARQAAQDIEARENQERAFGIQEQKLELEDKRIAASQTARASRYGVPINAESIAGISAKLQALNPEAFAAAEEAGHLLTGGQFRERDMTAEELEAHPAKAALFTSLMDYYTAAQGQADEVAIQDRFDDTTAHLEELDPEWFASSDGQKVVLGLREALSGSRMTPALAEQEAKLAIAHATRKAALKKDRRRYVDKAEELFVEYSNGTVDKGVLRRAREKQSMMLRSDDPYASYLQVKAMLDPESKLIAEQAYADGRAQLGGAEIANAERTKEAGPLPEAQDVGSGRQFKELPHVSHSPPTVASKTSVSRETAPRLAGAQRSAAIESQGHPPIVQEFLQAREANRMNGAPRDEQLQFRHMWAEQQLAEKRELVETFGGGVTELDGFEPPHIDQARKDIAALEAMLNAE